jgi:hypothetical protein
MENKETLEEVLERVFDIYSTYTSLGEDVYEYSMDKEDFKEASLEIAKWQAGRMYYLIEALNAIESIIDNDNPSHEDIWRIANGAIEQFKQKEI